MFPYEFVDCYRLLPSGRLERIEHDELVISYRESHQKIFKRLAYERAPTLVLGGDIQEYFRVEVHPRYAVPPETASLATAPYRYLVLVMLHAPMGHFVFVEDLPDLLPFLAQLATIANATLHAAQHELDVIAEEVQARADQDAQSAEE